MKINEEQKQQYQEYVKQVTPTHNLLKEVGKAFLTGGLICVLGQFLQNTGLNIGMDQKTGQHLVLNPSGPSQCSVNRI